MAGDIGSSAQATKQGWSNAAMRLFGDFIKVQFERVNSFPATEQTTNHFQGDALCLQILAQAVGNKMSQFGNDRNPPVVWHTSPSHMTVDVGHFQMVRVVARDCGQLIPPGVPPPVADKEVRKDLFFISFEAVKALDTLLLGVFAIHVVTLLRADKRASLDFPSYFHSLNKDLSGMIVPGTGRPLDALFKDTAQCAQKLKNVRTERGLGAQCLFLTTPFADWPSLSVESRATLRLAFMTPKTISAWKEMALARDLSEPPATCPEMTLDLLTDLADRIMVHGPCSTHQEQMALLPTSNLGAHRGNFRKARILAEQEGILSSNFTVHFFALRRQWQTFRSMKKFHDDQTVVRCIVHHTGRQLTRKEALAEMEASAAEVQRAAELVAAVAAPDVEVSPEPHVGMSDGTTRAMQARINGTARPSHQSIDPDTAPVVERPAIWDQFFTPPPTRKRGRTSFVMELSRPVPSAQMFSAAEMPSMLQPFEINSFTDHARTD